MSRLSKYLLVTLLLVFVLACNAISQPFNQAQDAVQTAQSLATAMPLETLQSFATSIATTVSEETVEAVSSALPDFGNMFDPQGEPVAEWKGVPIMSQATAGQEHDSSNYSFKFTGTAQEASDFYNAEMVNLGWTSLFSMPGNESGAVLAFQKDNNILTVTITTTGDATVVLLTLA
jgi:hypothetical protein